MLTVGLRHGERERVYGEHGSGQRAGDVCGNLSFQMAFAQERVLGTSSGRRCTVRKWTPFPLPGRAEVGVLLHGYACPSASLRALRRSATARGWQDSEVCKLAQKSQFPLLHLERLLIQPSVGANATDTAFVHPVGAGLEL